MTDPKALYSIGYGLYVVTTNDGTRDNGMIVNTVIQAADSPLAVSVCMNRRGYSYETVLKTGILNVNCLAVEAPFSVFEKFGFSSGRDADKFAGETLCRSENGLVVLDRYVNSFMSLKVSQYVDLGSHGMFICSVTESKVLNSDESMTYAFYHRNVKPKPAAKSGGKKRWVCNVCGYVYEGDELPDGFVCPVCGHPASDFSLAD